MSRARGLLASGLLLMTCACAGGGGVARPDRSAVLAEGKARDVPVYIYGVSWSSPKFGGGRMQVGVADFDEKDIEAIRLGVSDCDYTNNPVDERPLFLNGPFTRGRVFTAFPSWPMDYVDHGPGAGDAAQLATSSGHLRIRSITILYKDGSKVIFDKNMSRFLATGISNYCPNGPDVGNLPPQLTVERH